MPSRASYGEVSPKPNRRVVHERTDTSLPRGNVVDFRNGAWSPDGRSIVFAGVEQGSASRYYRQELVGGLPAPLMPEERAGRFAAPLWKRFDFTDPVGLQEIHAVQIADDETSYYYTFQRMLSDLFLIEGLH